MKIGLKRRICPSLFGHIVPVSPLIVSNTANSCSMTHASYNVLSPTANANGWARIAYSGDRSVV